MLFANICTYCAHCLHAYGVMSFKLRICLLQVERAPKKHVVEEFDYSDFYDDVSVSTVTTGPNVTEYEVRCHRKNSSVHV